MAEQAAGREQGSEDGRGKRAPQEDSGREREREPVEQTLRDLETDPDQGLSDDEASRRLAEQGPNAIEEKRHGRLGKFLSHFWGPIPWMIEAAAVLGGIARRWEDVAAVGVMLAINGGIGFWHEDKSDRAIAALKEKLAPEARVLRGGRKRTIPAGELVAGDIVDLDMGDVVPADARLLGDASLSVDESALTGESLPVDKEEGDPAHSGTTIQRGHAGAVITATGPRTRFARTVELVESADRISHFQRAVMRIGYFLIGATLGMVVGIAAYSLLGRHDPWTRVLMFALGLTLAGIPAALPAVLSVTMTVGASRLAGLKAIVARLSAMEELAGLEVLCADKTGTLTRNQLKLEEPVLLAAGDPGELILAAALTARRDDPDPIDGAILDGLSEDQDLDRYEVLDFEPFDPTSKRAEARVRSEEGEFSVAKGAPQVILELTGADDDLRSRVTEKVDELGRDGFRALGVARDDGEGWRYLGILPLLDPPREDSAEVVAAAGEHGIDIRMVTGDHVAIGRQVAERVGLGTDILEADELFGPEGDLRSGKEEDLLEADGFAEVTPEHKFNIIKAFQASDRIVGMTGDGVNDAPALKQADVGIAVPGATDAARSAAAVVLTEQGLAVMTRAVEEARRIFERMTGYATFRITETMRVLLFITLSILFFNFYPVTPIMIVLLAVLNDIPIMTIAWDNARTARTPVRWDMKRVLTTATMLSVAGVISSFLLFWFVETQLRVPRPQIQTMMFLKLLVAGHMTIFLTRSRGALWSRPYPSLVMFLALEGTQVVGTLVAAYGVLVEPIAWKYIGVVWGWALLWVLVLDRVKLLTYRWLGGSVEGEAERKPPRDDAEQAA